MKKPIYLFKILIFGSTFKTDLKRKYTEDVSTVQNQIDEYNNLYSSTYYDLKTFIDDQFAQPQTKITKFNVFDEDPQKLLSFLDAIEYPGLSTEVLNEYLPIDFNKNDLNEIIQDQEVSDPEQIDTPIQDVLNNITSNLTTPILTNFLIDDTKDETDKSKEKTTNDEIVINSCDEKNLENIMPKKNNISLKIFVEKIVKLPKVSSNPLLASFKSKIEIFISDYISDFFSINLLDRLKAFESACIIFDVFQLNLDNHFSVFELSHDLEIAEELIKFNLTFDKNSKLDIKTCNTFSNEFGFQVMAKFYTKEVYKSLSSLSNDIKKIVFYYELMKLYKYVGDIPEIITLGGLYKDNLFRKLTCHIHLINLFIEKSGGVKDNKNFILFMIVKTLQTFYSAQFDFFSNSYYEIPCKKGPHDIYFFFWEPSSFRYHLVRRRKRKIQSKNLRDKKYFKAIFLIYLYQYMILIEYSNLRVEFSYTFQVFIDKVLKSKGCVGCFFNEFMKIIETINKKTI